MRRWIRTESRSFIDGKIINPNPTNIDFLEIGNPCNFSCPDCEFGEMQSAPAFDRQEEVDLITKVMEDYPESSFFLYPPEITTSPYLLPVMKATRQRITLTNGLGLNERMLDRLKEAGLRYLKVTLFATPGEQMRWQAIQEPMYWRIRKNIERAVDKGFRVFLNTVLNKDNLGSIVPLARQSNDMGIDRIKFIRERTPVWKPWYLAEEDMDRLIRNVEEAKQGPSPRIQLSLTGAGPNLYGKSLDEARKKLPPQRGEWPKSPYLCPAIDQNYWGISPRRGKVYGCFFMTVGDPVWEIGTLDQKTKKVQITGGLDLRPSTLKKRLRGNCAEDACEYQSVCMGGCRRTAYMTAKWKGEKDPLYAGMDICLTKTYGRVMGNK
ncbi:MAG: radical SAM protein [DPANN group archaeon]|nr:radical SAM protein [DPANN group archaeon]